MPISSTAPTSGIRQVQRGTMSSSNGTTANIATVNMAKAFCAFLGVSAAGYSGGYVAPPGFLIQLINPTQVQTSCYSNPTYTGSVAFEVIEFN